MKGQVGLVVPFPHTPVAGNTNPLVTNLVTVGPDNQIGGGYTGDLVMAQCQWGPCSYNVVTHAIWQDVIACTECAQGRGGRYQATLCDTHQGVSVVFSSPSLFPGTNTYIIANNYSANAGSGSCNTGPLLQFYTVVNGVPSFTFGADISINRFIGFKGRLAYFVGSPNLVVDMVTRTMTDGMPSGFPYDARQATDSLGQKWTRNSIPNGLRVVSTTRAVLMCLAKAAVHRHHRLSALDLAAEGR